MITADQIPPIKGLGLIVSILTWTGCLIGLIMFVLRTYVNATITKRWTLDFYFAVPAFIAAVVMSGMMSRSVYYGLGTHQNILIALDPDGDLVEQAIFFRWMVSLCCHISILFGKLAIICFLVIVSGKSLKQLPHRKWSIYLLGFCHVFLTCLMIPMLWLQCNPAAKSWDGRIKGTCSGQERYQNLAYFWGSFEAVVDIALAIYPAVIFYKLHMRLAVKIGLSLLFSAGLFAAATCVVKVFYAYTITESSDRTYGLALLGLWYAVETWMVFIASCLPTVAPFFKKMFPPAPPLSAFDLPAGDVTNTYHSGVTAKSKFVPREVLADVPLRGIVITEEVKIKVEKKWRHDFHVAATDFFKIK